MDLREARAIADEMLYQVDKCREEFPGAYEYIMGNLDTCDDEVKKAIKIIQKTPTVTVYKNADGRYSVVHNGPVAYFNSYAESAALLELLENLGVDVKQG